MMGFVKYVEKGTQCFVKNALETNPHKGEAYSKEEYTRNMEKNVTDVEKPTKDV